MPLCFNFPKTVNFLMISSDSRGQTKYFPLKAKFSMKTETGKDAIKGKVDFLSNSFDLVCLEKSSPLKPPHPATNIL